MSVRGAKNTHVVFASHCTSRDKFVAGGLLCLTKTGSFPCCKIYYNVVTEGRVDRILFNDGGEALEIFNVHFEPAASTAWKNR